MTVRSVGPYITKNQNNKKIKVPSHCNNAEHFCTHTAAISAREINITMQQKNVKAIKVLNDYSLNDYHQFQVLYHDK